MMIAISLWITSSVGLLCLGALVGSYLQRREYARKFVEISNTNMDVDKVYPYR